MRQGLFNTLHVVSDEPVLRAGRAILTAISVLHVCKLCTEPLSFAEHRIKMVISCSCNRRLKYHPYGEDLTGETTPSRFPSMRSSVILSAD